MGKRLSLAIILLASVWAGCSPHAASDGVRAQRALPPAADAGIEQVRFASGSSAYDIPFETNANKIYLPARINGAGPFWLILDSGAAFDVLDRARADALGLALDETGEVNGAGERKVSLAVASDVKVNLVGVEFSSARLNVVPVSDSIAEFEGRGVDGLLGHDFFERFVVEIDYAAGRISLHDPRAYTYAGRGEAHLLRVAGVLLPDTHHQEQSKVGGKLPDAGDPRAARAV